MWRRIWQFVLILIGLLIAPVVARAESPSTIEVAKFSSGAVGQAIPDGWKPLTFKKIPKHTSYEVVKEGESVVVKAMSDASASGLTKEGRIDAKEYPGRNPEQPTHLNKLALKLVDGGKDAQIVWIVDGAPFAIAQAHETVFWPMTPGAHRIQARLALAPAASRPVRVTVE
jgi:membrane carboxypeptidase/penicillin-binding protein PbpC